MRIRRGTFAVLMSAVLLASLNGGLASACGHYGGHQNKNTRPNLIAMGDSVAAGYSAGATADSPYAVPCERTTAAYPVTTAGSLELTDYNLACTGASAAEGLLGKQTRNGVEMPSQIRQLKKLKNKPAVVTLSIGANDVRWFDFMGLCLQPTAPGDTGCDTAENTAQFTALLDSAKPQIKKVLRKINKEKPGDVVVVGYYDPFGATAGPVFGLTTGEVSWYQERVAQLNGVLEQLADNTGAQYVDTSSLNAAAGDVILGDPTTTAGFAHPSPQGQAKIADLIVSLVNS